MNLGVQKLFEFIKNADDKAQVVINNRVIDEILTSVNWTFKSEKISHSVFYQEAGDNDLIINHLYRGFSSFVSRFSKDFPRNSSYQEYVSKNYGNVYEFPYSYGFNANLHKHYFKNTIKLPYDSTDNKGIGWEDLTIKVNKKSGLLDFYYKGEVVLPLFIGSLIKMLCPPIQNIMDLMSSHGAMYFDLGDIYLHQQLLKHSEEIIHVPRLSISNDCANLIVNREKWLLRVEKLNQKGLTELESQKYLLKYFGENNLPTKFFVRGFNKDVTKLKGNSMKPQYINLSSPMLTKVFNHIIQLNELVSLEEKFPVVKDSDEYCQEFVLENTFGGLSDDNVQNL